jgi:hypothetical protein
MKTMYATATGFLYIYTPTLSVGGRPVKAAAAPGPASGAVARGVATVGWVAVAVALLG